MASVARAGNSVNDRSVLLSFFACVALAVCWQQFLSDTWEGVGVGAGGLGAAEALGFLALFLMAWRVGIDQVLTNFDLFLLALASLTFAFPSLNVVSIALLIVGALFVQRSDARIASFGQVLLALVFFEVLGRVFFDVVAEQALRIEASMVSGILSLEGNFHSEGLSIAAPSGHTVMIETRCSAFHNVSMASLLWISMIKIERYQIERRDWLVLGLMIGFTILWNTIRIALMAQSRAMYEYWHNGDGVGIFSATLVVAMFMIFLGATP